MRKEFTAQRRHRRRRVCEKKEKKMIKVNIAAKDGIKWFIRYNKYIIQCLSVLSFGASVTLMTINTILYRND